MGDDRNSGAVCGACDHPLTVDEYRAFIAKNACPAGGKHRFTVAVEWLNFGVLNGNGMMAHPHNETKVTRLRCESCPEEIDRG